MNLHNLFHSNYIVNKNLIKLLKLIILQKKKKKTMCVTSADIF